MGPLFVGLNPAARHPGTDWNNNSTFAKLFDWCDRLNVRHFSFVNVSHKSGVFDRNTIDVPFLMKTVATHNGPVVALGREVAAVMERTRHSFFKMPHPSPLNRLLNDPAYEEMMLDELSTFFRLEEERLKERDRISHKEDELEDG
jgi:hypothetical protein